MAIAGKKDSISSLQAKAERALKEAVREVILENKRAHLPLIVWRDGKVAKVSPHQLFRSR